MIELVPMTDRARHVLRLAENAARAVAAPSIKSEHLLLALVEEQNGLAAGLLKLLGVDRDAINRCLGEVAAVEGHTNQPCDHSELDQLQRWAGEELKPLNHNYVGTEHLLLALTRVSSGRFPKVLAELSLKPQQLREEVYSILGHST